MLVINRKGNALESKRSEFIDSSAGISTKELRKDVQQPRSVAEEVTTADDV